MRCRIPKFARCSGGIGAILLNTAGFIFLLLDSYGDSSGEYSIGNPSAEEQFIVELINRARKNPAGEGALLRNSTDPDLSAAFAIWNVDLATFESEMASYAPVPPVAINAKLSAGSRVHTADMLSNAFQGHRGTDGSSAGDRIARQGYNWSTWGENVYAYALSPLHLHAGFIVDWGVGPGGMQDPRGHREGLMAPHFREIGLSRITGTNGAVGPEVVDQVLASELGTSPFITGVVYYDVDQNGEYGIGEGIGGVTATSAASVHFSNTADSGGYALPVVAEGPGTVRFESAGQTLADVAVAVSAGQNVKVDLPLPYFPPVIRGNEVASLSRPNIYSFTRIPGASAYDVKIAGIDDAAWSEGAESGTLAKVIDQTSSLYSLASTTYAQSGSSSFHLTFPWVDNTPWEDQSLELDRELILSATSRLEFGCLFRWVTSRSKLYAEMSTDEGDSWSVLWERAGTDTGGDTSFSQYSLPLSEYAGKSARFRFRFRHHSNAYAGAETYLGVYLDDVTVSSSTEITDAEVTTIDGTAEGFTLRPDKAGVYRMAVRPRVPEPLPYGEALVVNARSLPTVVIEETRSEGVDSVSVTFLVEHGVFSAMALEGSSQANQGWTPDTAAELTSLGNGRYRFQTTNSAKGIHQFYRVTGTVD